MYEKFGRVILLEIILTQVLLRPVVPVSHAATSSKYLANLDILSLFCQNKILEIYILFTILNKQWKKLP